ncbi:MAG TPA: DUF4405 domain-containing protein [Prosthecochloris aestuarii]|uniref:DUF4405 domain-containing protein n=1 Tax=Prosthecochloris aestuarii TaxID=1102 RepID=A0A831SMI3_PROAE|nr:DUF4405 domain-containing protein [Prosthecochloris sp.]HED30381.1 DUF4405 domain-containing protein [Prosthecochloris aestuarii]
MKQKSFSWRAWISIGLFLSFFMILVSGIVLYLAPAGRVANWTGWNILGLTKTEWQHQHTLFSLLFAILSVFHLFSVNWKAFWSYLRSKTGAGLSKPAETATILLVVLLTGFGTYYKLPPFSLVISLGDNLTDSWEQAEQQPPVPHTERFTLRDISTRFAPETTPDILKEKLERQGLDIRSIDQTLESIAEDNNTTAEQVFSRLGIESRPSSGSGRGEGRRR